MFSENTWNQAKAFWEEEAGGAIQSSWSDCLLLRKGVSSLIRKCILPPYPPFSFSLDLKLICSQVTLTTNQPSLDVPLVFPSVYFLVDLVDSLVYSMRTGSSGSEKL